MTLARGLGEWSPLGAADLEALENLILVQAVGDHHDEFYLWLIGFNDRIACGALGIGAVGQVAATCASQQL